MPRFGDIIPNASGRSHIGIDGGVVAGSFDSISMLPFGHIIQLSGVFLDPIYGESGVIRYSRFTPCFELSINGGLTFDCLATSGQVEGMILGGLVTQDLAYQGGNEINLNHTISHTSAAAYYGVLSEEQLAGGVDPNATFRDQGFSTPRPQSFAIAASGHTIIDDPSETDGTSNYHDSYAYSQLGTNMLYIQGSGSTRDNNEGVPPPEWNVDTSAKLWLGVSGISPIGAQFPTAPETVSLRAEPNLDIWALTSINIRSNGAATLRFGGVLDIDAGSTLSITTPTTIDIDGNTIDIDSVGITNITAGTALNLTGTTAATLSSVGLTTVESTASDIIVNANQQLTLQAFAQSGQLRYQFGPFEAWHWSPSHTSDFFPIPHSGQINEMITLQRAYDDRGEVVQLLGIPTGPAGAAPGNIPIKLREIPGHPNSDTFYVPSTTAHFEETAALSISGVFDTPNGVIDRRRSSYLSLTSYRIGISASGRAEENPAQIVIRGIHDEVFMSFSSRLTTFNAGSGLIIDTIGRENMLIRSRANTGDGIGGQLTLEAFAAGADVSGSMRYEFGPNEAWHVKPSHTTDFFPIAHSGQVEEMIRKSIDPFSSGIHALGAPDISSTILDITPYGNIYQLSGIFVDPLQGTWGGIRYNRNNPINPASGALEYSVDEGETWEPFSTFASSVQGRITSSIATGGVVRFIVTSTDNASRQMVPSGMKMLVLACQGGANLAPAATNGVYTIHFGIREYAANEVGVAGGIDHTFASVTGRRGILHAYSQGSHTKPLATIDGGKTWSLTVANDAGSADGTGTGGKTLTLTFKYVKDNSSPIVI